MARISNLSAQNTVPYANRIIPSTALNVSQGFGAGGSVPGAQIATAPPPPPQPEYTVTVRGYYPSASLANTWGDYTTGFVSGQGAEPSNTVYAVGICSDDVDAFQVDGNIGQFPTTIGSFLGPFYSGGLAGYPFVGSIGFGAFASHITDSGSLFITSTPHIGITSGGLVGYQYRRGQSSPTPSTNCGAVHGAVGLVMSDPTPPTQSNAPYNNGNYELWQLASIVYPFSSSLSGSISQNVAYATSLISSASFAYIYANSGSWHAAATGSSVYVLGGIFINADYGYQAYVDVNQFWRYNAVGATGSWTNLTTTYKNGLFAL